MVRAGPGGVLEPLAGARPDGAGAPGQGGADPGAVAEPAGAGGVGELEGHGPGASADAEQGGGGAEAADAAGAERGVEPVGRERRAGEEEPARALPVDQQRPHRRLGPVGRGGGVPAGHARQAGRGDGASDAAGAERGMEHVGRERSDGPEQPQGVEVVDQQHGTRCVPRLAGRGGLHGGDAGEGGGRSGAADAAGAERGVEPVAGIRRARPQEPPRVVQVGQQHLAGRLHQMGRGGRLPGRDARQGRGRSVAAHAQRIEWCMEPVAGERPARPQKPPGHDQVGEQRLDGSPPPVGGSGAAPQGPTAEARGRLGEADAAGAQCRVEHLDRKCGACQEVPRGRDPVAEEHALRGLQWLGRGRRAPQADAGQAGGGVGAADAPGAQRGLEHLDGERPAGAQAKSGRGPLGEQHARGSVRGLAGRGRLHGGDAVQARGRPAPDDPARPQRGVEHVD